MSDNLCLPKTHLLIILCVFMGLTVWYIHFNKENQLDYNQRMLNNIIQTVSQPQKTQDNKIQDNKIQDNIIQDNKIQDNIIQDNKIQDSQIQYNKKEPEIIIVKNENKNEDILFLEKRKALEIRDAEVKYNDFKPPERRVPEYIYPTSAIKQIINVPTRGFPDNYQLMGILLRDNTETAFNLFGRQTYPSSNQYEYYAQGTLHHNNVKLPIDIKNSKELFDNDEVKIPGTDETKGLFKVKLYNMDVPRYNPYQY